MSLLFETTHELGGFLFPPYMFTRLGDIDDRILRLG